MYTQLQISKTLASLSINSKFALTRRSRHYYTKTNPHQMSLYSKPLPPATTEDGAGTTSISAVHPDILEAHILTRLDGSTLASASCTSSTLYSLSSQPNLWTNICNSTWPSTTSSPLLRHLISTFPNGGPRAFFSLSFPLPTSTSPSSTTASHRPPPPELISAVDIHYQNTLIFSKIQNTETVTGWFRCSPFRIDVLDPKEVPARIPHPEYDDNCTEILSDMNLSWILIDPTGRRAVNLSSFKPVSVQRHWLSGEVQVRFATVLFGDQKGELVQCEIVVTCGGSEGGEMQVREVSLEMEDMEGIHMTGKESLVILDTALEGKRGKGVKREEEGRRRHREYAERKRERRQRKMRTEGALDMLSVAFGVTAFAAICFFLFCR